MLQTIESHLGYVPFSAIHLADRSTRFRAPDADAEGTLRQSLVRSGQAQPITLLEYAHGRYAVLDGHRRCAAIAEIRATGGTWEKVLAQVLRPESATPLDQFRLLRDRNLWGDHPYRLTETGRFFLAYREYGVSIAEIAAECAMSIPATKDLVELGACPPALARLLDASRLDPAYAVALFDRYRRCLAGPHADAADATAARVLAHARTEPLSRTAWAFLLDFYWGTERPFLAPAPRH